MSKAKGTVRTSVDLPETVLRKLHEVAARRGCSARKLILEAVEKLVEEAPAAPEPVKKERLKLDPPLIPSRGKGKLTSEQIYEILADFP